MLLSLGYVIIGIIVLMVAGDMLVKGAVSLALKLKISPTIIGLTIVAFGTSAPELMVSIQAALSGSPDLALGNVVGSNIANTLLIIGLPALIATPIFTEKSIAKNYIWMMVASFILWGLAYSGDISRLAGLGLFLIILSLIYYNFRTQKKDDSPIAQEIEEEGDAKLENWKVTLFLLIGIIGLPIGAQILIIGASDLARSFGISEAAIGLTIVAFGTSLPELAASIAAAFRKQTEMAIANVIGSNQFNILTILGITTMIHPISVSPNFYQLDIPIMIGTGVLMAPLIFGFIKMSRPLAAFFVLTYIAYIGFILV